MSILVFNRKSWLCLGCVLLALNTGVASAQTTTFTYQGKLTDGGNPANGNYDMQFKLFDTATVGTGLLLGTITNPSVPVTAGIFTVQLDFGAGVFTGPPRYLEIGVRPMGSPDPYTLLSPRQAVTSTPYSVRSLNSSVADSLSSACVGCVSSAQVGSVSGSVVTGTIPVASVPAGSGNYVQNTTSPQAASNFNISGDGTVGATLSANVVNATTHYSILGTRVFSVAGSANIFAGINSGTMNTGSNNSFVGAAAGAGNAAGGRNAFFGTQAGATNATGSNNAFFGYRAGFENLSNNNSFFGSGAGDSTTTGANNAFFGTEAGAANTTAAGNSFFGYHAGFVNTAGGNSFFGNLAGASNTTAANNSFFGENTGMSNQTGDSNSFFGSNAGGSNTSGANNSFFGSGAGASSATGSANAFFGYHTGINNTASFNSFFGNGAGDSNTIGINNSFFGYNAGQANTNGDQNSFFGRLSGQSNTTGDQNSFFGSLSGGATTSGCCNSFFGWSAGSLNSTGGANVFIGDQAGSNNSSGSGNTAIGTVADVGFGNLNFATAIGSEAIVTTSNRVQLGRNGSDTVSIGALTVASSTHVCINGTVLSSCSSSRRYKENIQPFGRGLELLRRLRPVTFDWIERREADLGLIAEEVGEVEPLLVTHNRDGAIEGVKYEQITTVLVNAVKEQQQIIEQQQKQIDALKKLVCLSHSQADVCK